MSRRSLSALVFLGMAAMLTGSRVDAAPPGARPDQEGGQPSLTAFVWTNDEVDMLRESQVPISIVGPEPGNAPALVVAAPGELESYDHTKDPQWYADQAAILRAEIEARQAELAQQQKALANAQSLRQTDPGIALDRGNAGITLTAGIENLAALVQEAQDQLDALADLAQRNDIPPGVLRG